MIILFIFIYIMATSQTFYPTQIEISPSKPTALYKNINTFQKQLDSQLNENIILKKHELINRSKELYDDIQNIKNQAKRHKYKIYQQEKWFEDNVQIHIKYDVKKWKDYDMYFRNYFKVLENHVHHHRKQNQIYRQRIKEKSQILKSMLRTEINQIVLKPKLLSIRNTESLMTKQSTIQLSYSKSKSIRQRVKTQSSLPSLKPYNKIQRFKTIQSQRSQEHLLKRKRKANSYMQPIGSLKSKQTSLFPLLIEMFLWYKNTDVDYQNDWFANIILKSRNFDKLIHFLQRKSITKKIIKKK